jgi:hypothetical protein
MVDSPLSAHWVLGLRSKKLMMTSGGIFVPPLVKLKLIEKGY